MFHCAETFRFLASLWDMPCLSGITHQYVSLVRVRFFPFLGNEQELVEEEEGSLILGSLQTKRSFKNQLSVADKIGALPVSQKALDFLKKASHYRGLLISKQNSGPLLSLAKYRVVYCCALVPANNANSNRRHVHLAFLT